MAKLGGSQGYPVMVPLHAILGMMGILILWDLGESGAWDVVTRDRERVCGDEFMVCIISFSWLANPAPVAWGARGEVARRLDGRTELRLSRGTVRLGDFAASRANASLRTLSGFNVLKGTPVTRAKLSWRDPTQPECRPIPLPDSGEPPQNCKRSLGQY